MHDPVHCSPDKPWGIHQEVVDNGCPRCGWSPDRCDPPVEGPDVSAGLAA